MFEITKQEAIDRCLRYVKDQATRYQRGSSERDLLLHDLENIDHCIKYIRKMMADPEQIYIDITGNNVVNDMLLAKNLNLE